VTLDQDVAILRSLPIFAAFPDEQLRLVAFSAEPLELPPQTVLFREGAAADSGYIVISGAVRLYATTDSGLVEKGTAGPGALIGELALLCPTTRPATAETVESSRFLSISRRMLRRVLEEYPEMAERLRRVLSDRLAEITSELQRTRRTLLAMDENGN
jgi:CRP-like cAMP-binding protein